MRLLILCNNVPGVIRSALSGRPESDVNWLDSVLAGLRGQSTVSMNVLHLRKIPGLHRVQEIGISGLGILAVGHSVEDPAENQDQRQGDDQRGPYISGLVLFRLVVILGILVVSIRIHFLRLPGHRPVPHSFPKRGSFALS